MPNSKKFPGDETDFQIVRAIESHRRVFDRTPSISAVAWFLDLKKRVVEMRVQRLVVCKLILPWNAADPASHSLTVRGAEFFGIDRVTCPFPPLIAMFGARNTCRVCRGYHGMRGACAGRA